MREELKLVYEIFDSSDALNEEDKKLVNEARAITSNAYAPYSNFFVGAAALLTNGQIIKGSNQENASYPVGTCAERVLLGTAAVMYAGMPIKTMAISYDNKNGESNHPISPCGMCRQALKEFEDRTGNFMRLILTGKTGKVIILDKAVSLLPLSVGSADLK